MTTSGGADEAFGDDIGDIQGAAKYFATKPVWTRELFLQLIRDIDESKRKQVIEIFEQGMEDARKRRAARRAERQEQQEREAHDRERIRLVLLEQEKEDRMKRREARKAKSKSKGMER